MERSTAHTSAGLRSQEREKRDAACKAMESVRWVPGGAQPQFAGLASHVHTKTVVRASGDLPIVNTNKGAGIELHLHGGPPSVSMDQKTLPNSYCKFMTCLPG